MATRLLFSVLLSTSLFACAADALPSSGADYCMRGADTYCEFLTRCGEAPADCVQNSYETCCEGLETSADGTTSCARSWTFTEAGEADYLACQSWSDGLLEECPEPGASPMFTQPGACLSWYAGLETN